MRRLTGLILMLVFLAIICRPDAAYSINQPTDLIAKDTVIPDDDIVACADDPAPGMDGRIPGLAGKPINLLTGAETTSHVDLRLGNLFPIAVKRSYNSRTSYDSPLGYGWAVNYDRRLYTYPDGSVTLRKECGWKRRFTWSVPGYITPLGESGTLVLNVDGTYTHMDKNGDMDIYDAQGRLVSEVDSKGNSLTITYMAQARSALWGLLLANIDQMIPLIVAYDYKIYKIEEKDPDGAPTGASVTFQYDSSTGRLTFITDGNRTVTYGHDTFGNLTTVSGPDVNVTYGYTESSDIHRMTTVDEGNGAYVNEYDTTTGRVNRQTHGAGVIDFEYLIPYKKTRVTSTVKDTAGSVLNTNIRTVEFGDKGQPITVTDTLGNVTYYNRDGNARITREEYWEKTGDVTNPNLVLVSATNFTYDHYGNMKTKVEASNPSASDWAAITRTTTYIYQCDLDDPSVTVTPATSNKVAQEIVKSVVDITQNRVTTNTYDATGNLLTTTEQGLLGDGTPYSYTTTYTYYPNGKVQSVDGPRTDVSDITSYTYDPTTGYLTSMTQPTNLTTTYSNFDALGNPQTVTDPNNNVTTYTYDSVGRVASVKAAGDTAATQYFYVSGGCQSCGGANKIDHIVLPEGNTIWYTYDTMGNLSALKDGLNNSINYTYDSEGNKLTEQIKDSGAVLQKTLSYQYDVLNRLSKIINPDNTFTQYGYDFLGNRTSLLNANSALTTYSYDPLNRLNTVIQPGYIETDYGYDQNNDLTVVNDDNGNMTTYMYDDRGRVYQVISPDTGTTTYSYDPAGNMVSKTDAKGVTISYVYDALNRLTHISADTGIVYVYDTCVNGKGRLCSMNDASGTTIYEYTPKGQVKKETKTIDSHQYVTQYTYDQNGNLKMMTYPSGRVITYNMSNDKVISVLNNAANLATNINYKPFGGMSSLTYGNGIAGTIGYDNQYRVSSITAGAVNSLNYNQYDSNGNIMAIQNAIDPTKNKSFTYDTLDRLFTATSSGIWGNLGWTYDGVGNRQTEGPTVYTYTAGTNKLSGAGSLNFGYDNNGNAISQAARSYTYNENQRLIQVNDGSTAAYYTYNGNGQRVKKNVSGTITVFHYSLSGQIIAESNNAGTIAMEYVYLNGQPLAMIANGNTYYYHNDHLATPQKMTDSSGLVVWSADYKPFGEATITVSTITNNLRFPGQYFDAETGLHYNYLRDYSPTVGRYIEKDPIGIRRGRNHLYAYTKNKPVNYADRYGLQEFIEPNAGETVGPEGEYTVGNGQIRDFLNNAADALDFIIDERGRPHKYRIICIGNTVCEGDPDWRKPKQCQIQNPPETVIQSQKKCYCNGTEMRVDDMN